MWSIFRPAARLGVAGLIVGLMLGLAACSDGPGSGGRNVAPSIAGSPSGTVQVGLTYSFQPVAQDPEQATLDFSIQNKPAWASFNTVTGLLRGIPAAGDIGTTSNIIISVNDGAHTASLMPFSITVLPAGTASAKLSWTVPTSNTDGSPLTDLAGFRIHYGLSASAQNSVVDVPGATSTSYTVASLLAGTYYFSVSAYTNSGVESALSATVSANVQ